MTQKLRQSSCFIFFIQFLKKSFFLENYMEISDEYIEKSNIRYDEYLDNVMSMFNINKHKYLFDGKLKKESLY